MAISIVRLGEPRAPGEGLRIGTVRRPPRGVRKQDLATHDWYDVWYPNLAPDAEDVKLALQSQKTGDEDAWRTFVKRYRRMLAQPDASRTLDLLAALSAHGDFSIGCYCEDESHCHRSVLRAALTDRGAVLR